VNSYGEIIAGVLATSADIARKAAKLVHVTYEVLPCITTMQVIW
jgi:xanthine dehydrogenase molybdopterin-binding subunit B